MTISVKIDKEAKAVEERAIGQHRLECLHAKPLFNLATEPWVAVQRDGQVSQVGVRELLLEAHLIADLAIPHPILKAAVRRFLGGLAADLVRRESSRSREDWWTAHEANTGFSTKAVDALLAAHADHLWLWHPDHPFLQDRRLIDRLVLPQDTIPIQSIAFDLPGESSVAWWAKYGEPALRGGISPAQAAVWLCANWFYATNGNCAKIQIAPLGPYGAQHGGAFVDTVATLTNVWRIDSTSIFRTLLRNLTPGLVGANRSTDHMSSCAWLDADQPLAGPDDPLYQYTLSTTSVLLAGRDDNGQATAVVRGAVGVAKELIKIRRDAACQADPHRIMKVATKAGAKTLSPIRLQPSEYRPTLLSQLCGVWRQSTETIRGVLASSELWLHDTDSDGESIELCLATKCGTGSSPVWEEAASVRLSAQVVDPHSAYWYYVHQVLGEAFDPKIGMRTRLRRAIRAMYDNGDPQHKMESSLEKYVLEDWTCRFNDTLESALSVEPQSEDEWDAYLDKWRKMVTVAALGAFATAAAPYLNSMHYAPRYAQALQILRSRSSR